MRWRTGTQYTQPSQPGSLLLTTALAVVGRLMFGHFVPLQILSASAGFQPPLFYCCHPRGNPEMKMGYWRKQPSCTCCLPSILGSQTLLREYLALSESSIAARERVLNWFQFQSNWFQFPVSPTPTGLSAVRQTNTCTAF